MARGPKKHLKRIAAPKHWGLDKMGGYWAPRPSGGPHKLRECLPLLLILRNKLRFAHTAREAKIILQERNILVDGKIRKDMKYPAGFMDVISIPKIGRHYRLLFDTIGRFTIKKIPKTEASFKLVKVTKIFKTKHGYPAITTSDGRVIRFIEEGIKINDSLKISIPDQKVLKRIPFQVGALCVADSGDSCGRIGEIIKIEKHMATYNIVYCRDIVGNLWTTRKSNLFVIGENKKSYVSLPHEKGVKLDPVQFRVKMMKKYEEKRKKTTREGFTMDNVRSSIKKKKMKSKKRKQQEKPKKGKKKKKDTKKEKKKEVKVKAPKEVFEILKFRTKKTEKPKKEEKKE